jgi:MSHA biogenesis protein MshM
VYIKHFGLSTKPFLVTPETESFFVQGSRKALVESLLYVLSNEQGIIKITGEVGSGKTTTCRYLLKTLPPAQFKSLYLADPTLTRDQLLFAVADGLDLQFDRAKPELIIRVIRQRVESLFAEGKRVVLMIDEAHAMPEETLDQIRLLSQIASSGNKIMHVLLLGPEELDHNLAMPELRAVRDRITQSLRIKRLRTSDIGDYLAFKMQSVGYEGPPVFTGNAIRIIARLTNGLPRRINVLADKALLACALDRRYEVRSRDIAAAAKEIKLERSRTNTDGWMIGVGGFFLGATCAIFALTFALSRGWIQIGPATSVPVQASEPAPGPLIPSVVAPIPAPAPPAAARSPLPSVGGADASSSSAKSGAAKAGEEVDAQAILNGTIDNNADYSFIKPEAPKKKAD